MAFMTCSMKLSTTARATPFSTPVCPAIRLTMSAFIIVLFAIKSFSDFRFCQERREYFAQFILRHAITSDRNLSVPSLCREAPAAYGTTIRTGIKSRCVGLHRPPQHLCGMVRYDRQFRHDPFLGIKGNHFYRHLKDWQCQRLPYRRHKLPSPHLPACRMR